MLDERQPRASFLPGAAELPEEVVIRDAFHRIRGGQCAAGRLGSASREPFDDDIAVTDDGVKFAPGGHPPVDLLAGKSREIGAGEEVGVEVVGAALPGHERFHVPEQVRVPAAFDVIDQRVDDGGEVFVGRRDDDALRGDGEELRAGGKREQKRQQETAPAGQDAVTA